MIVLDTNVLSELMRPEPAASVTSWVLGLRGAEVFTTAVTVAELRYGVARLPDGRRRREIGARLSRVLDGFDDRALPFDVSCAEHYAEIVAGSEAAGRTMHVADGQIAATVVRHGGVLATRNTRDFSGAGITVIDPWAD